MRCGELYAVEEGGGAACVECAHGEGVDDGGEGDLDGAAVLERVEVDGFAGRTGGEASAVVTPVAAVVEVAEVLAS